MFFIQAVLLFLFNFFKQNHIKNVFLLSNFVGMIPNIPDSEVEKYQKKLLNSIGEIKERFQRSVIYI